MNVKLNKKRVNRKDKQLSVDDAFEALLDEAKGVENGYTTVVINFKNGKIIDFRTEREQFYKIDSRRHSHCEQENDNLDTERAVLGYYILGWAIDARITEEVFSTPEHKAIFQACKDLKGNGAVCNLTILIEMFGGCKDMDCGSWVEYLNDLTKIVPTAENVEYYEDYVLERYNSRCVTGE